MTDDFWRHVKGRDSGSHRLDLITRDVEGFAQWEVCVDCVTQFRGTQREAEAKWRSWVRSLNAIAQKRREKSCL
jgi:hypothetical protein